MTGPIGPDLDALADEFELLGDWEERYRHLIDLGRRLEPLAPEERSEANKVRGCASQVWLVAAPDGQGGLSLRGDSDSTLVRGLIAVLIRLFAHRSAPEVRAFDLKGAFERLGFAGAISAQRSNGFFAMVERVRRETEALASA